MNAAAVFISLLFWGWLWGVWGSELGPTRPDQPGMVADGLAIIARLR